MTAAVSPLRLVRWIAWGAVGFLTAAMLYLMMALEARKGAVIGGPFTLTAMTGQRINVGEAEKGRPYAAFFGFTHCPDICPTSMYEMGQLLAKLGDKAKDFRVYFITVDPERDTAEQLRLYLSAFDPRLIGMTGTPEEIAVVAKAHRAFYRKVPTPSGYTMDHTATVFLFDRKGDFFGTLDFNEADGPKIAKMERLLQK